MADYTNCVYRASYIDEEGTLVQHHSIGSYPILIGLLIDDHLNPHLEAHIIKPGNIDILYRGSRDECEQYFEDARPVK